MIEPTGRCPLCHEDKPLVRSHAIPHAAFRNIHRDNGGSAIVVSDDRAKLHRSGRSGHDRLLCSNCERKLNFAFDAPSINFLRSFRAQLNAPDRHTIGRFNNDLLASFLLSMMWRAALSSDPMYASVALAPAAKESIRRMLNGDGESPFEIASYRVHDLVDRSGPDGFDKDALSSLVLTPVLTRYFDGKLSWQFAMTGFLFEISIPRLSLLRKREAGMLRRGAALVLPLELNIFDNPALVKVMMAGYSKHRRGHSILHDRS